MAEKSSTRLRKGAIKLGRPLRSETLDPDRLNRLAQDKLLKDARIKAVRNRTFRRDI